jgi:hypothetical protein
VTEAEAFGKQAASELKVLELLLRQIDTVPDCHCLHYLQMVTEKAAKAAIYALGDQPPRDGHTHKAASRLIHALKRCSIGEVLGWPRPRFRSYTAMLDSLLPLLGSIERLHPALGPDGPNVEYPWHGRADDGQAAWRVPAEWPFDVPLRSRQCANLIDFLRQVLNRLPELARLRHKRAGAP